MKKRKKAGLEELRQLEFEYEDALPKSPLPFLEETIGAFLCLVGGLDYFTWRGSLYTFVRGKPVALRKKQELTLQHIAKTAGVTLIATDDQGGTCELLVDGQKRKFRLKERGGVYFFERIPARVRKAKCEKTCFYNRKGKCLYDPLGDEAPGCKDPLKEMRRLEEETRPDVL